MTTATLDHDTADKYERIETRLIHVLQTQLANHLISPIGAEWQIVDAVADYPGLGLVWEECEGRCGLLVWGADPATRLVLCDSCSDDASARAEEYLHSLIRRGQESERDDHGPSRLADVLTERTRAAVEAAEARGEGDQS